MFDKWEEEKYKQTSSVSIRHGVGDGITDVNGLNRRSTVSDVLDQLSKLLNLDSTKWVIIENTTAFIMSRIWWCEPSDPY